MKSFGLCGLHGLQNIPHRNGKQTSHLLIVLGNQALKQLVDVIGRPCLWSRGMPLDQLPWESLILVDLNKDMREHILRREPRQRSPNPQS